MELNNCFKSNIVKVLELLERAPIEQVNDLILLERNNIGKIDDLIRNNLQVKKVWYSLNKIKWFKCIPEIVANSIILVYNETIPAIEEERVRIMILYDENGMLCKRTLAVKYECQCCNAHKNLTVQDINQEIIMDYTRDADLTTVNFTLTITSDNHVNGHSLQGISRYTVIKSKNRSLH